MNKRTRLCRLGCLLLALALLCGCGLGEPEPEPEPTPTPPRATALWLWRELPMAAALEALAGEYNTAQPAHPLQLRLFDSEEAMAAAMNAARPDLLLCTGERGLALAAQGKLRKEAPAAVLDPAFLALDGCVGRGFFPLGAELPVLAVNAAGYLASPVTDGVGEGALSSPESLCSLAAAHGRSTGQPFFAAGSWAEFFSLYLRQGGEVFDGRRELLRESERAAALYNLLAETAFARGLYTGAEDAGTLVRRGYVICALLPSRALAREAEGLVFVPAPRLEGGEDLLPARIWGLAVTAENESADEGVKEFLTWLLEPERCAALALDEGLLPAAAGGTVAEGEDGSLEEVLRRSLAQRRLYLVGESADRARQYEEFDAQLRAALALLD